MKEKGGKFDKEEFMMSGVNKQVGLLRGLDAKIVNFNFGVKAKLEIHETIKKIINDYDGGRYKIFLSFRQNNIELLWDLIMIEFSLLEYKKDNLKKFLDLKGIERVREKINNSINLIGELQKEFFRILNFYTTKKEDWLIEGKIERLEDEHDLDLDFAREIFFGKNFKPRPKINGHYLRRFMDSALIPISMTAVKGTQKGKQTNKKQKGKATRKLEMIK